MNPNQMPAPPTYQETFASQHVITQQPGMPSAPVEPGFRSEMLQGQPPYPTNYGPGNYAPYPPGNMGPPPGGPGYNNYYNPAPPPQQPPPQQTTIHYVQQERPRQDNDCLKCCLCSLCCIECCRLCTECCDD